MYFGRSGRHAQTPRPAGALQGDGMHGNIARAPGRPFAAARCGDR